MLLSGSVAGRPLNIRPHNRSDLGRGVDPLGEAAGWQSSVEPGTTEAGNPQTPLPTGVKAVPGYASQVDGAEARRYQPGRPAGWNQTVTELQYD